MQFIIVTLRLRTYLVIVTLQVVKRKLTIFHEVLEEASKINDSIRTEIILKDLAKKFEIGYNTLEKSFKELVNTKEIKKEVITTPKTIQHKKKDKYQKASLNIIYYMFK